MNIRGNKSKGSNIRVKVDLYKVCAYVLCALVYLFCLY